MELIEEQYSNINSKINTIPGIGTLTGSVILSSIEDINRFESIVKLRAYIGMDPVTKQSGEYSISCYIAKSGNPLLRYALYLSTVSAIRFNPVVRRYYIRKKEQGMKGNKLMITCANKLLNINILRYEEQYNFQGSRISKLKNRVQYSYSLMILA